MITKKLNLTQEESNQLVIMTDKSEFFMELIQSKPKFKNSLGRFSIGQLINCQFQYDIDGLTRTPFIIGTIDKLFETENAGYALIKDTKAIPHIVCLG